MLYYYLVINATHRYIYRTSALRVGFDAIFVNYSYATCAESHICVGDMFISSQVQFSERSPEQSDQGRRLTTTPAGVGISSSPTILFAHTSDPLLLNFEFPRLDSIVPQAAALNTHNDEKRVLSSLKNEDSSRQRCVDSDSSVSLG